MRRSPRRLTALALIGALVSFSLVACAVGQDSVFDEPLVTGETAPGTTSGTAPAESGVAPEGATNPEEVFKQKMADAEKLMQQKDWAGAIQLYNETLAMLRTSRALLNQGICFRELGAIDMAISSFSNALIAPGANSEPGLVEQVHLLRGELYVETGRYREAIDDFAVAAQLNPSNPESYYQQARATLRLVSTTPSMGADTGGQASLLAAAKSLERAIALRGDYGEAYLERGRLLMRLRQVDYAIEDLQQAVRLMGAKSEASAELGVAYSLRATQETYRPLPQQDKLVSDLRAAIEAMDGYLSSATLGQRTPPWQYRDPLASRPENVILSRGDTRISLGNELQGEEATQLYRAAVADADQLLKYDVGEEDEARAHFLRGTALRMLNDLEPAIEALTQSIQTFQMVGINYAEAHLRRGICYYYRDQWDLALQDFQAASIQQNNPSSYEPRAMMWAGAVYARRGEFENAIRSYTRSIAGAPRFTPALLNRGLAYLNTGRYDRAIEDFDVILRQDPENQQVQRYRELAQSQQQP